MKIPVKMHGSLGPVEVHCWTSRREMRAHTDVEAGCCLEVGSEDENPLAYVSVSTAEVFLTIGVTMTDVTPEIYIPNQRALWFLGCNTRIYALQVDSCEKVLDIDLLVPFYQFVPVAGERLLALYETGALLLAAEGSKIWQFDGADVVAESQVMNEHLRLVFMEGKDITLDLETGGISQVRE